MKQWYISQLECKPQDGDLTDFVVVVHWRRNATEVVNEKEYFASVYGTQGFSAEDVTDFIPYDQLTYEQVCGWLDAGLPVAEIDANLDVALENLIHPPVVTLPLPFTNP